MQLKILWTKIYDLENITHKNLKMIKNYNFKKNIKYKILKSYIMFQINGSCEFKIM